MRIVRIESRKLSEGAQLSPGLIGCLGVDDRGVIVIGKEAQLVDVSCPKVLSYYLVLPEASVQELGGVLELLSRGVERHDGLR